MIFLALKTEDGRITGKISFYCRMLGISRQGFYKYLANKDRPWKYQDLAEAMKEIINPDSLKVLPNCYIEKFAATLPPLSYLQFQRIGYFNIDKESTPDKLIFNRTVGLKDTWGKINK